MQVAITRQHRALMSGALVMLAALGSLRLGTFYSIGPRGLDASWVAVLGGAAERGELFGRELIFTGGPLSALYTRFFDPVQWPSVLAAGVLIAGALAWACARLASRWHTALLLPAVILVGSPDAIFISLPALAALAVLIQPGASSSFVLLAASATAASSLAKFSVFPLDIVSFAIIDTQFLRERRPPVGLAGFVVFLVGWFAFLQRGVRHLIAFLHYSLETSAGYSAGMGLAGSGIELASFAILAAVFGTIVIVQVFKSADRKALTGHVLVATVLVSWGFIGFKAGFVRHDVHSLTSWGILAIATAAYTAFVAGSLRDWILSAISLASIVTVLAVPFGGIAPSVLSTLYEHVREVRENVTEVADLAGNPRDWLKARETAMEQSRAVVRAAIPLPQLDGSVDVLPSIQNAVIAAGLRYRPRFTVQEYTTYTRALIDQNHASWFGPRAPDYILFGLTPIDGRLPALSEGPLWPDLLRYYEPVERRRDLAVLRRRSAPLRPLLTNPVTSVVRLGERFELSDDPAFLMLDIRLNGVGRALELLFRPPHVDLHLAYADGRTAVYRIIPEIARAGFVISPFIQTADDFVALALGESPAVDRPVSGSVEVGPIGVFAYDTDITLAFRNLDVAALRGVQSGSIRVDQLRRDIAARNRIFSAATLDPPYLDRIPEGLLAHAPRKITVPIENARSATVLFGITDAAWTAGKTEGACFRASSDAGVVMWERCLDPLRRVEDRGQQKATFALPPNDTHVVLETLCATDCSWDWTYWAGFESETRP